MHLSDSDVKLVWKMNNFLINGLKRPKSIKRGQKLADGQYGITSKHVILDWSKILCTKGVMSLIGGQA